MKLAIFFPLFLAMVMTMSSGCSDQEAGIPVTWTELKVVTLELELLDDSAYEFMRFGKEGVVTVTMGERNGPLTAPLFYWRVEGDHLLISQTPKSDTVFDFYQPRVEGKVLFVRKGLGGKARYVIHSPPSESDHEKGGQGEKETADRR